MGKNSPNTIAVIPGLSNKNNPPVGYFYYCFYDFFVKMGKNSPNAIAVIVTVIKITHWGVIFITQTRDNSYRIRRVFAHFYKKVIVAVIKITHWGVVIQLKQLFTSALVKNGGEQPHFFVTR